MATEDKKVAMANWIEAFALMVSAIVAIFMFSRSDAEVEKTPR